MLGYKIYRTFHRKEHFIDGSFNRRHFVVRTFIIQDISYFQDLKLSRKCLLYEFLFPWIVLSMIFFSMKCAIEKMSFYARSEHRNFKKKFVSCSFQVAFMSVSCPFHVGFMPASHFYMEPTDRKTRILATFLIRINNFISLNNFILPK